MRPIDTRPTACATCPSFAPTRTGVRAYIGVCRRKDGPTGKVFPFRWIGGYRAVPDTIYEPGCPLNPDPPEPPRKRPGMGKRKKATRARTEAPEE